MMIPQAKVLNTCAFINYLSKPWVAVVLQELDKRPLAYTELSLVIGRKRNATAYYVKHAVRAQLIKRDPRTKQYYLTFRGIKAKQFFDSISKIANLEITNVEDALTKITIDLNNNKGWLGPLIRSELRQAFKEVARK